MIRRYGAHIALVAAAAAGLVAQSACERDPSCEDAAARMVEIANAPLETGEATKPEAKDRLADTCEAEGWSPAIRECLADAPDQEAATACMRDLAGEP